MLASILSPGDVIQITILLMIPLLALYEFSIFLSVLVWRRREAKTAEAEPSAPEGAVAAGGGEQPSADVTPYSHGDPAGGDTSV